MAKIAVVLLALAACGGSSTPAADAPPGGDAGADAAADAFVPFIGWISAHSIR